MSDEPKSVSVDVKYKAYVEIYNNLDTLIWQIPGFLVGITTLAFGLIAALSSKAALSSPNIAPLLRTAAIFSGSLYLCGAYAMLRIRIHHTKVGLELLKMETEGYFHEREKSRLGLFPPAPYVFMALMIAASAICFILASRVGGP